MHVVLYPALSVVLSCSAAQLLRLLSLRHRMSYDVFGELALDGIRITCHSSAASAMQVQVEDAGPGDEDCSPRSDLFREHREAVEAREDDEESSYRGSTFKRSNLNRPGLGGHRWVMGP